MEGRVLAVDPGSVRIGVAISDPMRVVASPLTVVKHVSLEKDLHAISLLCEQHEVTMVIIGQALGPDGETTPASRHAQKIAEGLLKIVSVPVVLWDESGSTQKAINTKVEMGVARKKRSGHLDAYAAAIILQSFIDTRRNGEVYVPEE